NIGRNLLDNGSQLLEAPGGLCTDLAHLAVDWHPSVVIRRERDALGSEWPGQTVAEGDGRRIKGEGIKRTEARHCVEEPCEVGHIACHRPLHGKLAPEIGHSAARHTPRRWPQAHDRAVAA